MKKYSLIITAISLMFGSLNALAKDYKVEVLIFKNLTEQQTYESSEYAPPIEMVSGSGYWAVEPEMLNEQARLINEANSYQLTDHLSWGQESLPYKKATAISLSGDPHGWLKVYANHLLYVNIDLDFAGYRLTEKRRIKLDEQHFFDHPKFGLLVQVSRLPQPDTKDSDIVASENDLLNQELMPKRYTSEEQSDVQLSYINRIKAGLKQLNR